MNDLSLNDLSLNDLTEDMLFEIKQYFLSCKKCKTIIVEDEILEKCDACKAVWCCSKNNTNKRYFEISLNVCKECCSKFDKKKRMRRENIVAYNYFST